MYDHLEMISVARYSLLVTVLASIPPLNAQEVKFIDLTSTKQRTELRHPPAPLADCSEGHCRGIVTGGGSVGDGVPDRRDPHALGIYLLRVSPTDISADQPFEAEFKVLNTGRASIELPISPHLSDLQPAYESTAFNYRSLALVVRAQDDAPSARPPCIGFVELFGAPEHEGSLLVLKPAEWLRVRANVKLTTCSEQLGPVQLIGEFWLRRNMFRPEPGGAITEVHNLFPNTTPTPPIAAHLIRRPASDETGASRIARSGPPQSQSELAEFADRIAQDIKSARKQELFPKLLVIDFADEKGHVTALGEYLADVLTASLAQRLGSTSVIDRKKFRDYLLSTGISPFDLQDIDVARWNAGKIGANLVILGHLRPLGAVKVTVTRVSDKKELSSIGTALSLTDEMESLSNKPLDWPATLDVVVPCVGTQRDVVAATFKEAGVKEPVCIRCPIPQYSDEARREKFQGNVKLNVVIDEQGHARTATIIKGDSYRLAAEATSAVKKWSFQPATKDGKPVTVCVPIEVTFRLY
jgi:TonB family protein